MTSSRIETLREMLKKKPDDSMALYMLGTELHKAGQFEEAVERLEAYLSVKRDEGAAYRILADSLVQLGKLREAREALRLGAEAARAHNHEGMADEFEERIKEL